MSTQPNIENNKRLKQNPFGVPANYFQELEKGLLNIPAEHPQTNVRFLQNTYVRVFAFAATLILAFTIGWLSQANASKNEELTSEDIVALTESGYLPYSEFDVLMVLSNEDFEAMNVNTTENTADYLETTEPDLVEDYYLLTENAFEL